MVMLLVPPPTQSNRFIQCFILVCKYWSLGKSLVLSVQQEIPAVAMFPSREYCLETSFGHWVVRWSLQMQVEELGMLLPKN